MPDNMTVWVIGAGPIAGEYAKVLSAQRVPFVVVGRGQRSAAALRSAAGWNVVEGGVSAWIHRREPPPRAAIVAVGAENLASVTVALIEHGVRQILVEKPAGLSVPQVRDVAVAAQEHGAAVYVAYNRRFYSSVTKARKIIEADGGVSSFTFEFTEWSHKIETLANPPEVLRHWFLANSTHVIDTAFFLGGKPKELSSYSAGGLAWHAVSIYGGAGISETGALFSYHANWKAPGRWGIELLTTAHRLILRPLEKLQVQEIGKLTAEFIELEDQLDVDFKPGFFRQVEAFLSGDTEDLLCIAAHASALGHLERINGGAV